MSVSEFTELDGRLLVIFDGRCGLCNRSVRWFLRRDRGDRMRFVASESSLVAVLLARNEISTVNAGTVAPSSIVVVRDAGGVGERVLVRSDAVLAMLEELPRPGPAIARVLGWIPRPVRDLGYRLISRWRYRIWGRLESCPLPTAEERGRFL
jgi:predicted DCC family thiol-disulfide oxidoreductase YuxK